jgi:hypothetical protein
MALQKINWLQIDTNNVPSGSTVDLGSIDNPLHAVYAENLYLSGTSLSDLIATGGTGGGGTGSSGTSGTSGTSGLAGSSGTSGTSGTSGSSGLAGSSGTSGTSGISGTSGTSGTSGQEGHLAKWKFKATTDTSVNPGNNYFAMNAGSWGSSPTEIAINDKPNDLFGASISSYLDSIQIGTILKVVNLNSSSTYKFLQVTQVTPYDFGYEKYGVVQIASNGTDPSDGDIFTITPIGIPGSLTLSGTTDNGVITLNGVAPYATVESNMSFDGSNLNITGSARISNNLTVDGTITANQLIISSSVTNMTTQYASGSTAFGDTQDDTHNFTGSIYTTGSMVIKGDLRVEGTTTLVQTTDINADSLIISGAMSVLKNQIGAQIKSASLTIQNLGTLGDRSNMSTFTIIDCGDGFF